MAPGMDGVPPPVAGAIMTARWYAPASSSSAICGFYPSDEEEEEEEEEVPWQNRTRPTGISSRAACRATSASALWASTC
jgi:hypothetical protein